MGRTYEETAKFLLDNAIPNGECLECHLVPTSTGYGQVYIEGKNYKAHRVIYTVFVCDPGEALILHSCDNRLCINPKHLSHGTHQDNVDDMLNKGRQWDYNKDREKLNTAKKIYPLYKQGLTNDEIAERIFKSRNTVQRYTGGVYKQYLERIAALSVPTGD